MPQFLSSSIAFTDVTEADEDGLLAIGGDLSSERLLLAYAKGIFPWYEEPYPVLWWSPDPRMILFPEDIIISHSLRQRLNKKKFEVRIDTAFEEVIKRCAENGHRSDMGTWITPEMIEAYSELHFKGYAHSFETWNDNELVGGLYGVSLGRAFFGESMFHQKTDASKIALVFLTRLMKQLNFHFIDVQQETSHLKSMGAKSLARAKFLDLLNQALKFETIRGKWTKFGPELNS
ncbi:MAG: leucyl/phenylalanyl-tRNA--protein transferase [Bacteroidales bacterium]|nr:leucyl/phenylalanyl-tRNA--protein transferase [Bacteroidales bacterium]